MFIGGRRESTRGMRLHRNPQECNENVLASMRLLFDGEAPRPVVNACSVETSCEQRVLMGKSQSKAGGKCKRQFVRVVIAPCVEERCDAPL